MLDNQQASSAGRENADMLERWNRDAADVKVRPEVEPEQRHPDDTEHSSSLEHVSW